MAAGACVGLLAALAAGAQEVDPAEIPWEKIEAWASTSEAPAAVRPAPAEPTKAAPKEAVSEMPREAPREGVKETDKAEPPAKADPPAKAEPPAKAAAGVPLEVERALRAAGWTAITGNWKQLERNVYEVTDGRLDAQKTNGAINIAIQKGGTGTVAMFVRGPNHALGALGGETGAGYGYLLKGGMLSMYTPYLMEDTSGKYYPYKERSKPVTADAPKHVYGVEALTNPKGYTRLTYYMDGNRQKTCEYKITTEGIFVVVVQGTAILESPQAIGQ
jgi:hypothetical protein